MVTARTIGVISVFTISIAALLIWLAPPAISAADNPAIERHRNLGKAFFENPTTHIEAIAEFKKALDLAALPKLKKLKRPEEPKPEPKAALLTTVPATIPQQQPDAIHFMYVPPDAHRYLNGGK